MRPQRRRLAATAGSANETMLRSFSGPFSLLIALAVCGCTDPGSSGNRTTGVSQAPDGPQSGAPAAPAKEEPGAGSQERAAPTSDLSATLDPDAYAAPSPESWPSFRNGPQLRGIATTDLPEELELLWETTTPDGVNSTPAIVGGRVYIGTLSGDVLCFSLRDGTPLWKYRSIESDDPKEFAPGFRAPVTVSAQTVFVGDEDGVFHAIDRATGRKRWTVTTGGEIVGGATLLPDERVMFGSHDGYLYCLNAQSGAEVWKFPTQGPVNGAQAVTAADDASAGAAQPVRVNGSLALVGRYTFVTGCDKPILRVVDIETGEQTEEAPLDSLLIASPALVGDVLYFGTDGGQVIALDWRKKEAVWTYADPQRQQQINSCPAVTDELVFIGSGDKRLHCIDRATGDGRWTFETRAKIDGSPVVVGGRVFFGSGDGNLYGVRSADGSEVWKYNAGKPFSGSPAVGEGCLVIGTERTDGKILCFGAK